MLPVILKREYTRAPSFSIISSMIDYNVIHDRLLPPFWLQDINVNVPHLFATQCTVLLVLFSLSPLHILSGVVVCFSSLCLLCSNPHCGEYGSGFLLFLPDFVLEAESSSWQLSLQVSFCFHHK